MVVAAYFTTFLCLYQLCAGTLGSKVGKKCNASDSTLQQCAEDGTELCNSSTDTCECSIDYVFIQNQCTLITSTPVNDVLANNEGNGSLIAGLFIPVLLIFIVICSIYFGKKYEVMKWIRNKISQRNNNYDEFMIGQDLDDDDPPLA